MVAGILLFELGALVVLFGLLLPLFKAQAILAKEDFKEIVWDVLDSPHKTPLEDLDMVYSVYQAMHNVQIRRNIATLLVLLIGLFVALIGMVLIFLNGGESVVCLIT